jgi:hypothetical protein
MRDEAVDGHGAAMDQPQQQGDDRADHQPERDEARRRTAAPARAIAADFPCLAPSITRRGALAFANAPTIATALASMACAPASNLGRMVGRSTAGSAVLCSICSTTEPRRGERCDLPRQHQDRDQQRGRGTTMTPATPSQRNHSRRFWPSCSSLLDAALGSPMNRAHRPATAADGLNSAELAARDCGLR